jgi:hypothetical protein
MPRKHRKPSQRQPSAATTLRKTFLSGFDRSLM